MKVHSYSITKEPQKGIVKSPTVWVMDEKKNAMTTLFYIKRPKHIKDDECWNKILDAIKIKLEYGFEIK